MFAHKHDGHSIRECSSESEKLTNHHYFQVPCLSVQIIWLSNQQSHYQIVNQSWEVLNYTPKKLH